MKSLLVVRLGALGDLVLCAPSFAALRDNFPQAKIGLLTQPQFAGFAGQMPWFDEVLIDKRASRWNLAEWLRLVRAVKNFEPEFIFDFQGKSRQSLLFAFLGGAFSRIKWSGAASFCSFPRPWPPEKSDHFTDHLANQLKSVGVKPLYPETRFFEWLKDDVRAFGLPEKYALIIPGCSPNHPYKRWPVKKYAELTIRLKTLGIQTVAIGTQHEAEALAAIQALDPELINLCGKTTLGHVAELARKAICVVGNDTGPTHLAAAAGGNCVALICGRVNPVWSAPKGPRAGWLQENNLADLPMERVLAAVL